MQHDGVRGDRAAAAIVLPCSIDGAAASFPKIAGEITAARYIAAPDLFF